MLKKIFHKLKQLLSKKIVIPGIVEKRQLIEHISKSFHTVSFVETGTFLGDTVEYFKNKFETIVSIELSEELAQKAVNRFSADKNVTIVQGDSSYLLEGIIKKLSQPVLFWLDGHFSSSFYVKDQFIQTAKGETNTPIIKELHIIFQNTSDAIILIDDARLFNGREDYPTIREIKKIVYSYTNGYTVFVSKDIIHILPTNHADEKPTI